MRNDNYCFDWFDFMKKNDLDDYDEPEYDSRIAMLHKLQNQWYQSHAELQLENYFYLNCRAKILYIILIKWNRFQRQG